MALQIKPSERSGMTHSLLVIDMQEASFNGAAPMFDTANLVNRINALATRVREASGRVIFVQHDGPIGNAHHPDLPGWQLLSSLDVNPDDLTTSKTVCDAFLNTNLEELLGSAERNTVIITGCETEYCVDTTVRSALARGYMTTVASDGHTCCDGPHLTAREIIDHHNRIWSRLGTPAGPATICMCSEILARR